MLCRVSTLVEHVLVGLESGTSRTVDERSAVITAGLFLRDLDPVYPILCFTVFRTLGTIFSLFYSVRDPG